MQDRTVEKGIDVPLHIIVENTGYVRMPFVTVTCRLPDGVNEKARNRNFFFSLSARNRAVIDRTMGFHYRGIYRFNIEKIEIYDVFRLFRFRIKINKEATYTILPNTLHVSDFSGPKNTAEEENARPNTVGQDRTEVADTRVYQMGDSFRSIHWKLSSKTDDLIVKLFNDTKEKQALFVCDLKGYGDFETNERATDRLIQMSMAMMEECIEYGHESTIAWYDAVTQQSVFEKALTNNQYDSIYSRLAPTQWFLEGDGPQKLLRLFSPTQLETQSLFLFTSYLTPELVAELGAYAESQMGDLSVIYYNAGFQDPKDLIHQLFASHVYVWEFDESKYQTGIFTVSRDD